MVTVPYETPNIQIVTEEVQVRDRIWVQCASREVLASALMGGSATVGEAVQMDWRTWCLITSHSIKEKVRPEILGKSWRSLMYQQLPSQKLSIQGFDCYRGAFHFQDWYRLIAAHVPNGWDVLVVACENHQLTPLTNVGDALKQVDSWMKVNMEAQSLLRSIWMELENICPSKTL